MLIAREARTSGFCINVKGVVTGSFDASLGYDGYVRAPKGKITEFADPSAGTGLIPQGTVPYSINSNGVITGYFQDANSVNHGFLRIP